MTEKERAYRTERTLRSLVECNKLTLDCLTTAKVARRLRMTTNELFRELRERHILFFSEGMWMLEPKYMGQGLLLYRYTPYYSLLGELKVRTYPVWTERGVEFLLEEFES